MEWEQPHWSGKAQKRGPSRQRLKANGFARLARFSVENRYVVAGFYLLVALLCTAFAAVYLKFDPDAGPRVTLDAQTLAVQTELEKHFPGIESTLLAIVESREPETALSQAQAVATSLAERGDLFDTAFVPGTGAFYRSNALLFHDVEDVRARIDGVLRMQPLYQALAAAPDIPGLVILVTEVGRAVEQGRSPPGFEAMMFAAAATFEGEVRGNPRPINWPVLAGLGGEARSQRWFVLASPRPGQEREAAAFAARASDGMQGVNWLWPRRALGDVPNPLRDFAVPAGLSIFVTLTLLGAGLGSFRLSIAVAMCGGVTLAVAAAVAATIGRSLDGAAWSYATAVLAPVLVSGAVIVIARVQTHARGVTGLHATMMAAQRHGGLISAFILLFCAFWISWLVRQLPSLSQFGMIAIAGAVTAWLTVVTLLPAVLALLERAEPPSEPHWLDEALSIESSHHARNVFDILAMFVLATAVFSAVFLPGVRFGERQLPAHPGPLLATPDARGAVHIIVPRGDAANLVAVLSRLPEVGAVRTIGQFMPSDVPQKLEQLRRLEGFVTVEPLQRDPPAEELLRNSLVELERQLTAIATGPATSAGLRDAALRLRRAVSQFADAETGAPTSARILELEQSLFGGLGNLSLAATRLAAATTAPPRIEDLDPALLRRFVSPDALWRIEVMPKPETGVLSFAAALRRAYPAAAGEPVAALARNEIIHHETLLALAAAAVGSAILALAALRSLAGWVVSLVPVAAFVTLTAAVTALLDITLNTAMLAAASAVAATLACSGMIAARHLANRPSGGLSQGAAVRTALLPLVVLAGAVAPLTISSRSGVAELGVIVSVMLLLAAMLCLLLVPALARWLKAIGA